MTKTQIAEIHRIATEFKGDLAEHLREVTDLEVAAVVAAVEQYKTDNAGAVPDFAWTWLTEEFEIEPEFEIEVEEGEEPPEPMTSIRTAVGAACGNTVPTRFQSAEDRRTDRAVESLNRTPVEVSKIRGAGRSPKEVAAPIPTPSTAKVERAKQSAAKVFLWEPWSVVFDLRGIDLTG